MSAAAPATGFAEASAEASILLVDDEPVVLESLQQTLAGHGYRVHVRNNGQEALAFLRDNAIGLILSDERMPGMQGLELLGRARELQPNATRILMTGVLQLDTVIKAINSGEIYRFIVKPWIREELLVAIRNGTQRYQLICRNAALQVETRQMNERLSVANQSLAEKIAQEAAQSRRLEVLNTALQQNFRQSIELCLHVMQTFSPGLGTQARRAHEICQGVADHLELSPEDRQVLEVSAWLHDIGLVGVPRRLITLWQRTPTALNSAELSLIRQHPMVGEELANFLHDLSGVGKVIRAHHESFDGSGFPDGLAGADIPWHARLLAVAIAFAGAQDESFAREEFSRQSGQAYDPEAISAVLASRPRAAIPRRERPVMISELTPGMTISKGIYGANGLLLFPEGQVLSEVSIEKLKNHHRVNSLKQMLLIYC